MYDRLFDTINTMYRSINSINSKLLKNELRHRPTVKYLYCEFIYWDMLSSDLPENKCLKKLEYTTKTQFIRWWGHPPL